MSRQQILWAKPIAAPNLFIHRKFACVPRPDGYVIPCLNTVCAAVRLG